MLPVLTPAEMREVDRDAADDVDVLVERAGAAVAASALRLLGGAYGRRVVVVAGPGNNGADGRVAARRLAARGVRVQVLEAAAVDGGRLPAADLVVDAAFGTGFRGTYAFPDTGGAPVLAVDVPSGIDGLTGVRAGRPPVALRTVTFAAWKPGLLIGDGPDHCGPVEVADIGLDVGRARIALLADADVAGLVPARARSAHKWHHAVAVVAGSPGMTGAAALCATGALRAGAGYVRLTVPGLAGPVAGMPPEVVTVGEPGGGTGSIVADLGRFAAVVVGPGLGRSAPAAASVQAVLGAASGPVVVDGDGLHLLGPDPAVALGGRTAPTVLTPHDGEFAVLTGTPPTADRIASARDLAARTGAVVLLKGPTTVVASPDGRARLVRSGDERLATAGTGDVLAGTVAAVLALGADPLDGAAAAAHLHGRAASLGPGRGLVASDVAALLPAAWDEVVRSGPPARP